MKITPQKQQIIGVRIGTAERVSETHEIRTLGRIAADENRIYPLVSAADGWMSYIPESNIGSLVQKNQLMALIRIYSYDFFSWQQRYLTELANTGRRRLPATNFTGARQPAAYPYRSPRKAMQPSVGMQNEMNLSPAAMSAEKATSATLPSETSSTELLPSESPQTEPPQPGSQPSLGMPFAAMRSNVSPSAVLQPDIHQPETPPSDTIPSVEKARSATLPSETSSTEMLPSGSEPPQPGSQPSLGMPFAAMRPNVSSSAALQPAIIPSVGKMPVPMQNMSDHSMHEVEENPADYADFAFIREDDILYANKAKLELLNLGVGATQLEGLARSGRYVKTIEVRSPVTGLVTERSISPLQKVDRGTECFRVADLSHVWILADVFNTDAQYIQPGMRARISLPRENRYVEARVSDVMPPFDAKTRTLKVRLEMDNPDYVFRPEMFVDVEFLIPLPEAITVPVDAILDSGSSKIVFVALKEGYFEPREVVTGWRFGDRVEIIKGLASGEQIVVSGNFLIDSESRMKLAIAGLMKQPETEDVILDKLKSDTSDQGELRHD
ncbi:MAG: efflux RND transporter periplasmic adaptor subunit [Desulfocapsaceae bacterium]|nr:efflux RND transporter periplasmic adaptor subunit [Desulfocapsaceae bacterium]